MSLCEDIVAGINLPGFDNSGMDGYADRAVDVAEAASGDPVSLPVVGEVAAGRIAERRLSPGRR